MSEMPEAVNRCAICGDEIPHAVSDCLLNLKAQLTAAQAEADRLRADLEVVVQRGRGLANDCAIAKREVERLRAALREIARATLASPETAERDTFDLASMDDAVREVLSRAFDNGPDELVPAFHAWYTPGDWLWWGRALGAFIGTERRRREAAAERRGAERALRTCWHPMDGNRSEAWVAACLSALFPAPTEALHE